MLHVFHPRTNLSHQIKLLQVAKSLLQKVDVLVFTTKLADAARVTTTDQAVSQQDDVTSNHVVVVANEKSGYTQLQQLYILLRDKFVRGWRNVQHRLSNCFAGMLRDELVDFVGRITVS